MDYAVRITRTFADLVSFYDKLTTNNIKYIVYQHDASRSAKVSRTHVHALLVGVKQSTDTLKNWVKEALNVTEFERGDWSFKVATQHSEQVYKYSRYITYMSKGDLEPLRNTIFTNEEIVQARGLWTTAVRNPSKDKANEVVVVSVTKKTKNELMGEVAVKLRIQGECMPQDKAIIKAVCDVLRENRIITNMYKLADYVDSYKLWFHGEEFADVVEKYYLQSRYR